MELRVKSLRLAAMQSTLGRILWIESAETKDDCTKRHRGNTSLYPMNREAKMHAKGEQWKSGSGTVLIQFTRNEVGYCERCYCDQKGESMKQRKEAIEGWDEMSGGSTRQDIVIWV